MCVPTHMHVHSVCPTLCDPMDCSPPGSSVHGLFQAKMEWIAVSYSRGFSWSRKIPDSGSNSHILLWQADSLPLVPPGRRAWQPTPVFLPGESHGQRGLAGYSPWGPKESDRTGQLGTAQHRCLNKFIKKSSENEKIKWNQKPADLE